MSSHKKKPSARQQLIMLLHYGRDPRYRKAVVGVVLLTSLLAAGYLLLLTAILTSDGVWRFLGLIGFLTHFALARWLSRPAKADKTGKLLAVGTILTFLALTLEVLAICRAPYLWMLLGFIGIILNFVVYILNKLFKRYLKHQNDLDSTGG